MPNWRTAGQITQRFAVSEARLAEFAARGNLPCRRQPGGAVEFDEAMVARLFRPRGEAEATLDARPDLGRLGTVTLGRRSSSDGDEVESRRWPAARRWSAGRAGAGQGG